MRPEAKASGYLIFAEVEEKNVGDFHRRRFLS